MAPVTQPHMARVWLEPRDLQLLLISGLMLLLEIVLIRWLSTEVRIFAYVNNFVLLACFLGIGLGCYYAGRPANPLISLWALMALLLLVTNKTFGSSPMMLSVLSDSLIWFADTQRHVALQLAVGLVATFTLFAVIAMVFFPLGQIMGRLFSQSSSVIRAYSLNIGASLVGVWIFNGLSFASTPPWVWFAVGLAGLTMFCRRTATALSAVVGCAVLLFVMAAQPIAAGQFTLWSPYQKLQVVPLNRQPFSPEYLVTVNTVNYMMLLDLSDRTMERLGTRVDLSQRRFGHYDIPYAFTPDAKEVLVVGAGGGNDVAGALRHGVDRVTAVEIDPRIYWIGRALHPEAPYSDPRVSVVIDDARSFFKKCRERFDVISFGLLDSHTLGSSLTNTRIDHYVYTKESFAEARALLKPGGVLTVAFETPRPWVGQRLRQLLRDAFGVEPLVFDTRGQGGAFGWGGMLFVISPGMEQVKQRLERDAPLRQFVEATAVPASAPVKLTTDDWPYLYLESPRIPTLHLCLTAILLLLFLGGRRFLLSTSQHVNGHFFFLGAAFLLLEFQNISKASLLFGATWLVNAFIISAILLLILIANMVAATWKRLNVRVVYACLFLSIAAAFLVPLSAFNSMPFVARGVAASLFVNLPILFAGLIFIHSFSRSPHPETALGSNLLGAGMGGLLESVSFVTGVNLLLVLVAVLYAASLACLPKR